MKPRFNIGNRHSHENLASKSVRGGMATIASQIIQFMLRTGSLFVLARLLVPEDFGLVAMVSVIINFATMFKDAGLSLATVQKESITHEQVSTLFWINIVISIVLGVIVVLAAPLVAYLYSKPELTRITATLSLSIIFSGLSIQHQALQKRNLHFATLAKINIASQFISICVTICLALLGYGYWALVIGNIVVSFVNSLLTFIVYPWRPSFIKRGTGVRGMLKFGTHITGYSFVNYFSRNADNFLIGRVIGADGLGLYSKAYQIFMMPIRQIRAPINNVAIPVLASLKRDKDKFSKYYKTIIYVIALLTMPLVVVMYVYAENIILLLLGNQWLAAVGVFKILALVGFLQASIQAGRGLPMLSLGFTKRYFKFGVLQSIVTVSGIVLGLKGGIEGVALGYGVAFYLLVPFTMRWTMQGSPVGFKDWLHAVSSPVVSAVIMLIGMSYVKNIYEMKMNVNGEGLLFNFTSIVIGLILGLGLFLVSLLMQPNGAFYFKSVYKQVRNANFFHSNP